LLSIYRRLVVEMEMVVRWKEVSWKAMQQPRSNLLACLAILDTHPIAYHV